MALALFPAAGHRWLPRVALKLPPRSLQRSTSCWTCSRPFSQEVSGAKFGLHPSRLDDSAVKTAHDEFLKNGVCLLPLQADDAWLEKAKGIVSEAFEEVHGIARKAGFTLGVGMKHGWNEIVQRADGRYDMVWGVNGNEHFRQIASAWEPFVESLLGGSSSAYRLQFNGVLMTRPGAAEQLWHIDGEHLFHDDPAVPMLPPHCLNIFLPLVPLNEENGGTEFCLASTPLTSKGGDEIVWQREDWKDEIGFKGDVLKINTPKGGVLAFDYRVLHRALAHMGREQRPVLYWTYTRRWFSDEMNFPQRKLADQRLSLAHEVRDRFPALTAGDAKGIVYCDGPSGSQLPRSMVDAMANHMLYRCGNIGDTRERLPDTFVAAAREACGALLGTNPENITFGLNYTSVCFALARMVTRTLKPGDNIVLSDACHDGNLAPWLRAAHESGAEVRWLPILQDGSSALDPEGASIIDEHTKLVSFGLAANGTGSVHSKAWPRLFARAREVGALSVVDGTHFVPHRRANLLELGADVLICSAYKFYAPHVGVMACRPGTFDHLLPYKAGLRFDAGTGAHKDILDLGALVPNENNMQTSPWEQGSQAYESLVGLEAAVQYMADIGDAHLPTGGAQQGGQGACKGEKPDLATRLDASFARIEAYEELLSKWFLEGAKEFEPHIKVVGSKNTDDRTPTFALLEVDPPAAGRGGASNLAEFLNSRGIYCGFGSFYAPQLVEKALNLPQGVTRIGFMHYSTEQDVRRTLEEIKAYLTM